MTTSYRGQSEVIGTVLLTAVVIILVTILGAVMVTNQAERVENTKPSVEFEGNLSASTLEVAHVGGEVVQFDNLRIVLRTDSKTQEYDLADNTQWASAPEDGDGRFEPGERISVSHSLSGNIRIVVADRSANGFVLYDRVKSV